MRSRRSLPVPEKEQRFTGDIQQIDSPYLDAQSNGLAYMVDKMKGQELFAHINLIKGERSQLSELASDLL